MRSYDSRASRRRSRGVAVRVVEAKEKLESTPEGQFGRRTAPSQHAVREAIRAGTCPWCGRGPWKVLARHVHAAHGFDRFELRAAAGLKKHASICDPAFSEERSAFAKARCPKPPPRRSGGKNVLSAAGRRAQAANARRIAARRTPEQRRAAALKSGAARAKQLRKPRGVCSNCGERIPDSASSQRRTCARPACRRAINARNMRAVRVTSRGEQNGQAKLTGESVRAIRMGRAAGEPLSVLAARFGVSEATVSLVSLGKSWRHV